jgi:hypothetical protein
MRQLFLTILVLGLFTAASCGKSRTGPVADPGATPAVPGGWPAVSDLADAAAREASYTETDLFKTADQYSELLPPVGTTKSAELLIMEPHLYAGKDPQLSRLSYALYSFHLESYDLESTLDVDWVKAPGVAGSTFVGLGNFDTGRWDWFATPEQGSPLTLPSFDPYISSGTDIMLVLVVVTGTEGLILSHLRVGGEFDEIEPNETTGDGTVNVLPDNSFTGYTGSIGSGIGYPDYDGSAEDGFLLFPRYGDKLTFTLTFNSATASIQMDLIDFGANVLASVTGSSPLVLTKTLTTDTYLPAQLHIRALSGYSDYSLDLERLHAPSVRISATPWTGPAPHVVDFSAAGSTDADSSIVSWQWDYDGDGIYDDSGSPSAQHTYSEGAYKAVLRITDSDGLTALQSTLVTAGTPTYNEVENNDAYGDLPLLPAGMLSGFRGSIGSDVTYSGYDGDDADGYFVFPVAGQKFNVTVDFDPLTAPDMQLVLADAHLIYGIDGTQVAPGRITVGAIVPPGARVPYLISVSCSSSGFSDYTLSKSSGLPPHTVISAAQAAGLAPLATTFSGAGSVDDGSIVKYEWDFDDDLLFEQNTGAVATVPHTFTMPGIYVARLRTTDDEGLMSTAQMTIHAWPVEYDEVEPNAVDSGDEVTLPSFPIASFKGSLGLDPVNGGYSGDGVDQFYLPQEFPAGTKLTFTATYDNATGDLSMVLRSPIGQYEGSSTNSGTETFMHTVTGSENLPLFIDLRVGAGEYTDYDLSVNVS